MLLPMVTGRKRHTILGGDNMLEVKILSQAQMNQQITTTYQIENRVFITESHFKPSGIGLSDLLIPIIANQHKEAESAALKIQETTGK